jgi:hypothetical protein
MLKNSAAMTTGVLKTFCVFISFNSLLSLGL